MKLRLWIDALGAGAAAGLIAEVLVLRMNPEVTQTVRGVLIGVPLWASWGMVMVGVPLLIGLVVIERLRRRDDRWAAPALNAGVYFVAAALTAVNAKFHAQLLSGPAHRVLVQDSVAWAIVVVLAVFTGWLAGRSDNRTKWRVTFSIVMAILPVVRLLTAPTPPREYLEVAAHPLGEPERTLLVIGLEGLDAKVFLADAVSSSYPNLAELREQGTWAPISPHRPFLRWALWTSAATGTYPGRHGVKDNRGWDLPLIFDDTLRLLPWTPEGSRMILPWGISEQVAPPPATVAPLWARIAASGVETTVLGWPGSWGDDPSLQSPAQDDNEDLLEPAMRASLEAALEPFPERRFQIWSAIERDQANLARAVDALDSGAGNVWVHFETLAVARRFHEPLKPRHTRERFFLELVMELVDLQVGALLDAGDRHGLTAVVSPFGLEAPGSFEKLKRTFGAGGSWHTSSEGCPEGLFILLGDGVTRGGKAQAVRPPDVAPTLCYLLDLPVAQYMEGSVLVAAATPAFVEEHPLRVVD